MDVVCGKNGFFCFRSYGRMCDGENYDLKLRIFYEDGRDYLFIGWNCKSKCY